ncbi:MAG: AraC family transcriptional regulator [Pseudomonadota bacterium]
MELLDAVLRSSAATAILIFLALAIRDGWQTSAVKYAVAANVSLLAVFLGFTGQPVWIYAPLRLIDAFSVPLVWWAALALLEEDFRPRILHWLGLSTYFLAVLPWRLAAIGWTLWPLNYPVWITDLIALALIGHLVWTIILGYGEDLVDKRRRLRLVLLIAIIVATLLSTTGENFLEPAGYGALVIAYSAAVILPVIIAAILWTSQLHPDIIRFEPVKVREPARASGLGDISPRDAAAHGRLIAIMETEKAYAEPGLTIGALADRVGIPEHQLRALINRSMGHRNFAAFLNHYRIEAAKTVLVDPEHARLPILTIAMDAGFASLAPFNRAFKQLVGQTPSDYRTTTLARVAPDRS